MTGPVTLLDHLHRPADVLRLDYDARLVRRKTLTTVSGRAVHLDLPAVTDLGRHAGLRLDDGTEIAIESAAEPVLVITGDLPRLAWHIGNRHTPCQISADHLVIRDDHVLRQMLEGLGARVEQDRRPFDPEGGAYGHGRTMGHSHGHDHG
jgi:urease accessory protein